MILPKTVFATVALAAVVCAPASAWAAQPTSVWASSELYENGFDHSAANVLNGDTSLAWVEGADGTGVGESLTFQFAQSGSVSQVVVYPGYLKSEDLFYQNCFPTSLLLETGDTSALLDLEPYAQDYSSCLQGITFTFDQPIWTDGTVRLTILSVREGSEWQDCCITGVSMDATLRLVDDTTDTAVNLSADDETMLRSIVQWVYDSENGYPSTAMSSSLDVSGVSVPTKAFVLYAYVYHSTLTDARVSCNGETDWVSEADLYAMAQELFGPTQCRAIVQEYIDAYSTDYRDGYVYTPGMGDFGAVGSVTLGNVSSVGIDGNGQLVVTGTVQCYDSSTGGYVDAGTWEARFQIASGTDAGFPYRFASLSVTPTGSASAGTTSTSTSTGAPSGYTTPSDYTYTSITTYVDDETDVHASLYQKAVDYCYAVYGDVPEYIDVEDQGEGTYAIHLYSFVDDHTATWNWFFVDGNGVGTDITGTSIDLNI